tara:strand:- start:2519 stop:3616 length:1098 start_codon:yes stop_codon:yes gene_type:complete
MRVLVLGADGYLGFPTFAYLQEKGHHVEIVDNFSKRQWEAEFSVTPLWPRNATDSRGIMYCDLLNSRRLYQVLEEFDPEVIIHYAEQPSAPMSMSGREAAVLTQTNNVIGTLNLIFGMVKHCPKAHLIKLGTMGEYGTPGIDIEEGWLYVTHRDRAEVMPFPKQPGSFYHLSKVHDSHNLLFAARNFGLRVTDLNQGIVYGVRTKEVDALTFHYDDIFGTVLNRFILQAANDLPLTVYGEGKHIRTFLNIVDTLQCVELALKNPAKPGEFLVRNQFTEKFSIIDLAHAVVDAGKIIGKSVTINKIPNPRKEAPEHYYNPTNQSFLDLGLEPQCLTDNTIAEMIAKVSQEPYDVSIIKPRVRWSDA